MEPDLELVPTPDGSVTLWSARYGQHYHNRNGAISQAQHVFLEGTGTHRHPAPQVLEIGFGAGLNFLTTLADTRARGVPLDYLGFESDPLPATALEALSQYHPAREESVWRQLLKVWPVQAGSSSVPLAPILIVQSAQCRLEIRFADATQEVMPAAWASALYLDGFSPETNPELWTEPFMASLAHGMQKQAWLATYSSAGVVKRALRAAGLAVSKHPGVAGKREYLRAQRI